MDKAHCWGYWLAACTAINLKLIHSSPPLPSLLNPAKVMGGRGVQILRSGQDPGLS